MLWFGLGMWWVWPRQVALIALVVELALALAMLFSLFTVSVAEEGLVLFRVNELRWSQVSGGEPGASSRRESATTELTGVRSSWLMFVQNLVLASLASCNWCRLSSSSECSASTPRLVVSSS